MTLVVHAPARYEPERRYVLDVVLTERLGAAWRWEEHGHPDVRIGLDGADDRVVTLPDVLFATDESRWLTAAALPRSPLPWRPVGEAGSGLFDAAERLPVVHGAPGRDDEPLVRLDDSGIHLDLDVFGSAFTLLTRYEEALPGERDRHGRFPASRALAAGDGFLGIPVVDAYVELLWAALHRLWPRLVRPRTEYAVLLSHDVDDPLSTLGRSAGTAARQLAGDVVRRRDLRLLLRRARALADARRGRLDRDPNDTFDLLMDVSEQHGLRSAFYFLSNNDVDPRGGRYDLVDHPWVRGLMGRVHRRGHEVGFHAGFGTVDDPQRTAEDFAHLRRVAEGEGVHQEVWGGRQHYLQWLNPTTWRNWDRAGLVYDCTLAFGDAVGFRTGTCHEYPVFDLLARQTLGLRERPFQVMDVTLFDYLGMAPDDARTAVLDVARACRRFRGGLGILWHNDELLRTTRQQRWYADLVAAVAG